MGDNTTAVLTMRKRERVLIEWDLQSQNLDRAMLIKSY